MSKARLADRFSRHWSGFYYAGANSAAQIAVMAGQFLALGFISPELMGIWQLGMLIRVYLIFTQFGVLSAFAREYPYHRARAEHEQAEKVHESTHAFNLLNALFVALVFVALAAVWWPRGWQWRAGLLAMALASFATLMHGFFAAVYRASENFSKLSTIRLFEIPLAMILPAGAALFGFPGYLGGQVLFSAGSVVLLWLLCPVRVRPRFNPPVLKSLLGTGFRLHARNYLLRIAKAMPRTALGVLGPTTLLGLFAPVMAISNMYQGISLSLQAYMFPKLTGRMARNRTDVGKTAIRGGMMIILCMLPFGVAGSLLFPWIIREWLPKYTDAIPAVPLALMAGVLRCGLAAQAALPAAKAWRRMYIHAILMFAIEALFCFGGALLADNKLLGVAWGMFIGSALMVIVTWYAVRVVGGPPNSPSEAPLAEEGNENPCT